MPQIVLNSEQIRTIQTASEAVALRDAAGNLVGFVSPPPTPDEIAEARRRLSSDGPWLSTKQVLDRLDTLEQG